MPKRWTEVEGWLSFREGEQLRKLAAGKDVLELGSWKGRSTVALAGVARSVVAVDSFAGDEHTGPADTHLEFLQNLVAAGVRDRVEVWMGRIEDFADHLPSASFDLVFIDGTHTAEAVERDTKLALRCVRPGGFVAWHDWNYESVRAGAVAAGFMATGTVDALGWAEVPK